ncbi:uncharacterized protein LOC111343345 isoform X2 [Stylophora pistillata]|uniref:uncharacterized protein LOC111343345 isoform X2 n=1 Tax=Stylophora pistillata TaxID=50429 RepID=UPI000C04550F|nr:uncharacterized protein LOC111343345 isoform X2 [Stylophora pistillata]
MFSGWKKTGVAETEDDLIRNAEIKRRLISELSLAVKELQRKHIGADLDVERNDEHALMISTLLEAVYLHGFQDHGIKLSNFYNLLGKISTEAMPTHSFWSLIANFTHKDVLNELEHLSQIHTPVGRCRAWIRLALNDGLMESYLEAILMDKNKLLYFYKGSSFMLDSELPSIMKTFLQGLGEFKFDFNYNTPGLNSWSGDTLALCGIWQLPKVAPRSLPLTYTGVPVHGGLAVPVSIPGDQLVVQYEASSSSFGSSTAEVAELAGCSLEESTEIKRRTQALQTVAAVERMMTEDADDGGSFHDSPFTEKDVDGQAEGSDQYPAAVDIPSEDDHRLQRDTCSPTPLGGSNKLGMSSGWSSTFETQAALHVDAVDGNSNDQMDSAAALPSFQEKPSPRTPTKTQAPSFGTLLRDYSVQGRKRFESPVYVDGAAPTQPQQIPVTKKKLEMQPSETFTASGFEVLSKSGSVHSNHGDDRSAELMTLVTEIATEQGLDNQNYQCKGCGRNIGMIYGQFKVCNYDACYYCFECHENEEHVIPARVFHNWDLRKHQVAKQCKLFLMHIEEDPLFNIDETNPTLYNVIKELHEIKVLRSQLKHLKGFIFTCKDQIAEDVRRRIWPREYLWDDIHQYSLLDLIQVQSGQLAHHLKKIIAHCTKHVYKCKLCCQKGFFCEICNNPKIMYPFEVKTTTQCGKCKALYHKACIAERKCPKCIRIRKKQSAGTRTAAVLEFDSPW